MNKILNFCGKHPAAVFSLLVFLLLSLGTCCTEINKLDVRFALFVQELKLSESGFFPMLNHVSYPDYFVPYFVLSWISTFGGKVLTLWTLALPTILLGSVLTGVICLTGERVQNGIGIAAAFLFLATPEVIYYLCSFGLDVPVALAGCLMLFTFSGNLKWWKELSVFMLLLIFCTLIRGSLGLLVFGSATGGYLLFRREWKKVFLFGFAGAFTAVLSVALILFLIYVKGGMDQVRWLIEWQIHNRIAGGDYFYYFLDGFASFLPVSFFAAAGIVIGWKNLRKTPLCGWLGWALCPMILLSIPGGKHMRYLLTILPAFALIGGWGIVNFQVPLREKVMKVIRFAVPWIAAVCTVCAAGILIVCLILFPLTEVPVTALVSAVLLFGLFFFFRKKIAAAESGPLIQIALCITFAAVFFVIPLTGMRESSRLFAEHVESIRKGNLYFYDLGPDHEDLKYYLFVPVEARRKFRYLRKKPLDPASYVSKMYRSVLISDTFPVITPEDVIILKENRLEEIQKTAEKFGWKAEILHSGDLGHRTYHAVRLRKL